MMNIHQQLQTRPTYLEIDMDAARHNFREIKKHVGGTKLLCVVKGNAYGHGSIQMAKLYEELGADYLGVAIPEEGVELRLAGVTIPILVLSAIADKQVGVCLEHNLIISAPSDEKLVSINKTAKEVGKKARVHIKIDTGMGRIGVNWERVHKFINIMPQCDHIIFEGIYSHLACSDEDTELNQIQIDRFTQALNTFKEAGIDFEIRHLANSGGLLFYPESHFDMVRPGKTLYGYFEGREFPANISLQPVMSWKSEVVFFKFMPKGSGVGYGHVDHLESDSRTVTIPVGYADGYQRALKDCKVIVNDTLCPVIGRICMDQLMVDIGRHGEAYIGDPVILLGKSKTQEITFYDLSQWSHTSIYELMCQISQRVPRIYIPASRI